MFDFFKNPTIDQLESIKVALEVLFVISGIGVAVGVAIEKERFDPGWKLLVSSLALDVIFTGLIFAADARISQEQRSEIISLQKRLAARTLLDNQIAGIAEKLKEYSGQEYEIIAFWNNKESVALMNRMISALDLAQWKQIKPDSPGLLLPGLIGVQVWVRPPTSEKTVGAARALVSALKGEALEAELTEYEHHINPMNARIEIWVGTNF